MKEKPRLVERGGIWWSIKNLDDKGLGQNKVLYSSSGVKLPMVNYHANSRRSAKETDLYLPAGFWLLEPHWLGFLLVAFSLSPHLAYFLTHPVGRPYFRLRGLGSLIVGLTIGGAVSMTGKVAVGLSKWSLWNVLISFPRCWIAEADSHVFSSSGYLFHETR